MSKKSKGLISAQEWAKEFFKNCLEAHPNSHSEFIFPETVGQMYLLAEGFDKDFVAFLFSGTLFLWMEGEGVKNYAISFTSFLTVASASHQFKKGSYQTQLVARRVSNKTTINLRSFTYRGRLYWVENPDKELKTIQSNLKVRKALGIKDVQRIN